MHKVRIVHVPVGQAPRVVEVEPTLAAVEALVGGAAVELVGLGDAVALVRSVRSRTLPPNGCGTGGPYFFTRLDGDGEHVSLSDAQCAQLFNHVAACRNVPPHPGAGPEVRWFDPAIALEAFLASLRRHWNVHPERGGPHAVHQDHDRERRQDDQGCCGLRG